MNSKKFNKKEKEIIAEILRLSIYDYKGNTKIYINNILAKLQEENIWGNIPKKDLEIE
jgi:hypothetical protein